MPPTISQSLNILARLVTLDKFGVSLAFISKFLQPEKAFSIDFHCIVPHWSIEVIFSLFAAALSIVVLEKSIAGKVPAITIICVPALAKTWVAELV